MNTKMKYSYHSTYLY